MGLFKKSLVVVLVILVWVVGLQWFSYAWNATDSNAEKKQVKVIAPTDGSANVNNNKSEETKKEKNYTFFEKIIWLNKVLWTVSFPMFLIAAKTLDPSFIYGEKLHLDKYLWQLWQMMRNFANFFLWFLFLLSILFYFFNFKQDRFSPKKIIPAILMGVVLVNTSWYLIWFLISLSVVLTIWVWAMPIYVLNNYRGDQPILLPEVSLNLPKWDKTHIEDYKFDVLYRGKENKVYAPCIFVNGVFSGKVFNDFIKSKWQNVDKNNCVLSLWWKLYLINIDWLEYWCSESSEKCKKAIYSSLKDFENYTKQKAISYKDIFHKLWYLLWGFSAIFYQIIDFWTLYQDRFANVANNSWHYLIPILLGKLLLMFLLLLPLFIFWIIMLVRVVLLWFVVIFSPFIFLFQLLGFNFWKFGEKFSLYGVLSLIFMPVFVVFALWIWLIFLTVINETFVQKDLLFVNEKKQDNNTESIVIFKAGDKISTLSFKTDFSISPLKDFVWWIFTSFFGMLLLWTLVMAALKTSSFTRWFVDRIKVFAEWMVKTAPIIPWWLSVAALKQWWTRTVQIPSEIASEQYMHSPLYDWAQRTARVYSWETENIRNYLKTTKELIDIFKNANWWQGFSPFDYEDVLIPKFKEKFKKTYDDLKDWLTDPQVVAYFKKNGLDIDQLIENIIKDRNSISWRRKIRKELLERLLNNLESIKDRNNWYYAKQDDIVFIWKDKDIESLKVFDLSKQKDEIKNYLKNIVWMPEGEINKFFENNKNN